MLPAHSGYFSLFRACIPSHSFSSVQFSHSVMSDSLWLHELQHARPPYPAPTPRVHSDSCPLSWWCHATISFSVIPFSSHPQSFPTSGSFQISHNYSAIIILMLITEVGKSLGENALLFAQIDVFWLQAHSTKVDRSILRLRPISSFPERNHNEDITSLLRIWGKRLSAGEPGLLK